MTLDIALGGGLPKGRIIEVLPDSFRLNNTITPRNVDRGGYLPLPPVARPLSLSRKARLYAYVRISRGAGISGFDKDMGLYILWITGRGSDGNVKRM